MINKSRCFSVTLWIKSKYLSLAFRPLGEQQLSPSLLLPLGSCSPAQRSCPCSPARPVTPTKCQTSAQAPSSTPFPPHQAQCSLPPLCPQAANNLCVEKMRVPGLLFFVTISGAYLALLGREGGRAGGEKEKKGKKGRERERNRERGN
uniref:Uncharacterized protein n=1 Tax=Myotis myotis TaxID=51298 RepID=A0A7J7UPD2_MYOMY|nr:hypothetical protein mMyoMyo1_008562 [Myotis myotis]